MDQKYIILRNARRGSSQGTSITPESAPGAEALGHASQNLPELVFESVTLNQSQSLEAAHDPSVDYIALDMPTALISPLRLEDDASVEANQASWGIAAVEALNSPRTGAGSSVCILDTGIDATHTAFAGVNFTLRDFTKGDTNGIAVNAPASSWDRNGHGTHCAGTIFGREVNGVRIGVAPGVSKALIGKVLDDNGSGTTDMLFNGLKWAISEGVDVVSMSIGFDFPGMVQRLSQSMPIKQATSLALRAFADNLRLFDATMDVLRARTHTDEGTIVVAASGNESDHSDNLRITASIPSSAEDVISVGALQQRTDGKLGIANFSNILPKLCAPGFAIRSARSGGGLTTMSGTSMACPHVAGIAALWWEAQRAQPGAQGRTKAELVFAQLTAQARSNVIASPFMPDNYGAGIVTAPTN